MKGARVFVGLSGGVDSAVSAALLTRGGAEVTCVFIKGWYPPSIPCTWAEDRRDAMRVAARLNLPFHTLEAGAEYKASVIEYLLAEYAAGRTPNPDIMCNRDVKFGVFYQFARARQADCIATGHYARIERTKNDQHAQLLRGTDLSKDQSYFLWAIAQDALDHTLFPIGHLEKNEVRTLAAQFNLPIAAKKDSQGICFLGSISVDDFLRAEFHPEPGKAVDEEGHEIGIHDGAILYTLGERAALTARASGPWFVVKKDLATNTLTVAHAIHAQAQPHAIHLTQTNWLAHDERSSENALTAQYRYHGPSIQGTCASDTFHPRDPLAEPVAPGQSLVLYRGGVCIGGGIIA